MVAAAERVRVPLQARAIRTRAAIVAAGMREFSRHGYAGTTVRTIARRARVGVGTFYQYFTDKDDLLREVFADRVRKLTRRTVDLFEADLPIADGPAAVTRAVRNLLRRLVAATLEGYRQDVGLRVVLTERRHADPILHRQVMLIEREVVERVAGLLRRAAFPGDAKATAYVVACAVIGSIHPHILGPTMVNDQRLLDALVDALVRVVLPLAPPAAPAATERRLR